MPNPGLKLAARYSYRPFALGFCGPRENEAKKILTNFLLGANISEEKVKSVFQKFIGAFPYYVLIAWRNKINDPFDKKVVEAYWVGNSLLKKVRRKDIIKLIMGAFVFPGYMDMSAARELVVKLSEGVLPHHSFHVLFLGSVSDTVEIKGKALDHCRISWGKVRKIKGDKLEVEHRPFILKPKAKLGKKTIKEISFEPNFGLKIKIGDTVSFHWNFVCDKLTKVQEKNIEEYTLSNLKEYAKRQKN